MSNSKDNSFGDVSESEEEYDFDTGYPKISTFDSVKEAKEYIVGYTRNKNKKRKKNFYRRSNRSKKTGLLQSINFACNRLKEALLKTNEASKKPILERRDCSETADV